MISLISAVSYLILCKIAIAPKRFGWASNKTVIERLKNITFNGTFVSLTIIPLICSALDVIYVVEGMLGMMAIQTLQIYLDNGRKLWNQDHIFVI